jgi:putative endonuclease
MKGWMYILECADSSYYTGSTNNIEVRFKQHQDGKGANHTKKRLPVTLVYTEEFQRIDEAFYREKQVQGWSRKKKEALINGQHDKLPKLSMAYRDLKKMALGAAVSSASTSGEPPPEAPEGTGNSNNSNLLKN